jgi:hypothetical protein
MYACGMSRVRRLPFQQPCYFGYGVGRPRKGVLIGFPYLESGFCVFDWVFLLGIRLTENH